jgi:antitoxin component YwqK of YwqJK toxin-antitoxin module
MNIHKLFSFVTRLSLVVLLIASISACGGDDESKENVTTEPDISNDEVTNIPPSSDFSPSKFIVAAGSEITFDGSTSFDPEGEELSYKWTIAYKPSDSTAILANNHLSITSLRLDKPGSYIISLIVNDGEQDSELVSKEVEAFITIDIDIDIPSTYTSNDLKLTSPLDKNVILSSSSSSMKITGNPQLFSLHNVNNDPVYVSIITGLKNTSVNEINALSTAISLVMMTPGFIHVIDDYKDHVEDIFAVVRELPEVISLAEIIDFTITADGIGWLDEDNTTFQEGLKQAVNSAKSSIDEYLTTINKSVLQKSSATIADSNVAAKFTITPSIAGYDPIEQSGIDVTYTDVDTDLSNTDPGRKYEVDIVHTYNRHVFIELEMPEDGKLGDVSTQMLEPFGVVSKSSHTFDVSSGDIANQIVKLKAYGIASNLSDVDWSDDRYVKPIMLTAIDKTIGGIISLLVKNEHTACVIGVITKKVSDAINESQVKPDSFPKLADFIMDTADIMLNEELSSVSLKCDTELTFSPIKAIKKFLDVFDKSTFALTLLDSKVHVNWNVNNMIFSDMVELSVIHPPVNTLTEGNAAIVVECKESSQLQGDWCDTATVEFGDGATEEIVLEQNQFTARGSTDQHIYSYEDSENGLFTAYVNIVDLDGAGYYGSIEVAPAFTCTHMGFESDGVSKATLSDGIYVGHCENDWLTDYPDSKYESPNYALKKLYGDGSDETKIEREYSYDNAIRTGRVFQYEYIDDGKCLYNTRTLTLKGMDGLYTEYRCPLDEDLEYVNGLVSREVSYKQGKWNGVYKSYTIQGYIVDGKTLFCRSRDRVTNYIDDVRQGEELSYRVKNLEIIGDKCHVNDYLSSIATVEDGAYIGKYYLYDETGFLGLVHEYSSKLAYPDGTYTSVIQKQTEYYKSGDINILYYSEPYIEDGIWKSIPLYQ